MVSNNFRFSMDMKCLICNSELSSKDIVPKHWDINEAMGRSGLSDLVLDFKLRKCRSCLSLVAVDPRRDNEYLKSVYESLPQDYWINLSNQEFFIKFLENTIKKYKTKGDLWDIGCGDGRILKGLSDTWKKSGIEPGAKAVDSAVESGLNVKLGTASSLKLKGVADIIICIDVLEHLIDPQVEISAIYNMLRPGGILIIFTGNAGSLNARLNRENWYYLNCIGHVCIPTELGMQILLGKVGFKIIDQRITNHEGSLSFVKWAIGTLRNLISKLFGLRTRLIFYYRDHQFIVAVKS